MTIQRHPPLRLLLESLLLALLLAQQANSQCVVSLDSNIMADYTTYTVELLITKTDVFLNYDTQVILVLNQLYWPQQTIPSVSLGTITRVSCKPEPSQPLAPAVSWLLLAGSC